MKVLWSLTKQANDPSLPIQSAPEEPIQVPAAPSSAPPSQPVVQPRQIFPQPSPKIDVTKHPQFEQMSEFLKVNMNVLRGGFITPDVKKQFDEWANNTGTSAALDAAGEKLFNTRTWITIKKRVYDASAESESSAESPKSTKENEAIGEISDELMAGRLSTPTQPSKPALYDTDASTNTFVLKSPVAAFYEANDYFDDLAQNDPSAKAFRYRRPKNEMLAKGADDAFYENGRGGIRKWLRLFVKNQDLLPDDIAESGWGPVVAIKEQIVQYLSNRLRGDIIPEIPSIFERLTEVMGSTDPKVRAKILNFIREMQNTSQKSYEMGQKGTAQTKDEESVFQEREDRSSDSATDSQDAFAKDSASEEIITTFMNSSSNAKVMRRFEYLTRPLSPENLRPRGGGPQIGKYDLRSPQSKERIIDNPPKLPIVDEARRLIADAIRKGLQEHGGWVAFFSGNGNYKMIEPLIPQYLKGANETTLKNFLNNVKNRPLFLNQINAMAKSGDPSLQNWIVDIAESHLTEMVKMEAAMPTVIRQVDHLTRVITNQLDKHAKASKQAGKFDEYATLSRRSAMIKAKFYFCTEYLSSILGTDTEKKLLEDPKGFYDHLSTSPGDWIPTYLRTLSETDPQLLKRPNENRDTKNSQLKRQSPFQEDATQACRDGGEIMLPNGKTIEIAPYETEIRPPETASPQDPGDRLAGYRKVVGKLFWQNIVSKFFPEIQKQPDFAQMTPQQRIDGIKRLAAVALATNPEAYRKQSSNKIEQEKRINQAMDEINRIHFGGDGRYIPVKLGGISNYTVDRKGEQKKSAGRAAKISRALGIETEDWFFRPPEYDAYNEDDAANINGMLCNVPSSYFEFLYDRQAKAKHRDRPNSKEKKKPWVDQFAFHVFNRLAVPQSYVTLGRDDFSAAFHGMFNGGFYGSTDPARQEKINTTIQKREKPRDPKPRDDSGPESKNYSPYEKGIGKTQYFRDKDGKMRRYHYEPDDSEAIANGYKDENGDPDPTFMAYKSEKEIGADGKPVLKPNGDPVLKPSIDPHTGKKIPTTRHFKHDVPMHLRKYKKVLEEDPKNPSIKRHKQSYTLFTKFLKAWRDLDSLEQARESFTKFASNDAINRINILMDKVVSDAVVDMRILDV